MARPKKGKPTRENHRANRMQRIEILKKALSEKGIVTVYFFEPQCRVIHMGTLNSISRFNFCDITNVDTKSQYPVSIDPLYVFLSRLEALKSYIYYLNHAEARYLRLNDKDRKEKKEQIKIELDYKRGKGMWIIVD